MITPEWLPQLKMCQPEAGSWSFLQVCHVGARAQGFGLAASAFLGYRQGADQKWSHWGSDWLSGMPVLQAED